MSRRFDELQAWWAAERTRHFLWLPVCFAAGIALYYSLPVEPPNWLLPLISLIMIGLAIGLRKRALVLMIGLLILSLGASWASIRTEMHQSVMLQEALTPREVIGVVRDVERTQAGVRLTLNNVTVDDYPAEKTPAQIRLSVKFRKGTAIEPPAIGSAIRIRAGLMPAMGPALPGGFDFARYFYFRDIGAVGFGLPPWEILGEKEPHSLREKFWSWRAAMTNRIVSSMGETGGIAAGLITGDGRAISEADFTALRASNLYHIIAISGEHMVVIAGVIFISLRMLLLLLPARFGQRPSGKSWAAAITLVLVTVYLFVTGLPMSAVRAYVMIFLVLLAVILRRHVDTMRSLAIAAWLMLVYDPASLLDPGFQLSFAATLAIIALVESRVLAKPPAIERGRVRQALHLIVTMLLVSVVAEAATTPLVISMFNNVSPYGVFANSLATPLVSLILMPLVALFFILLPFGLEQIALTLLGYGIRALMGLAEWVASFPHAQIFAPSLPGYGLALFVIGLLWLCLWQSRMRRYGLIAMLLGVATLSFVKLPDVLIGAGLKQIAFRSADGFVLGRGRAYSMVPEMWANGVGLKQLPEADQPHWRCDKLGCIAESKSKKVAFAFDGAAIATDCTHAQLVVTALSPVTCEKATVLDGRQLPNGSVTALWLDGSLRVESSADWQGDRPWRVAMPEDGDE